MVGNQSKGGMHNESSQEEMQAELLVLFGHIILLTRELRLLWEDTNGGLNMPKPLFQELLLVGVAAEKYCPKSRWGKCGVPEMLLYAIWGNYRIVFGKPSHSAICLSQKEPHIFMTTHLINWVFRRCSPKKGDANQSTTHGSNQKQRIVWQPDVSGSPVIKGQLEGSIVHSLDPRLKGVRYKGTPRNLPSLKPDIFAIENRPKPKKETHLPTIHFQGQAVSFREGNSKPLKSYQNPIGSQIRLTVPTIFQGWTVSGGQWLTLQISTRTPVKKQPFFNDFSVQISWSFTLFFELWWIYVNL